MESQPNTNPSNIVQTAQFSVQPQMKLNLIVVILLAVVISGVIFGFGGYYLGKQMATSRLVAYPQTVPTPPAQMESQTTVETTSPTSIPQEPTPKRIFTSWKPSVGGFIVNLPDSWSPISFDGGSSSEIRIYSSKVSWEDAHKETVQKPDMIIFIQSNSDTSSLASTLIFSTQGDEIVSNEVVIQGGKAPLTLKLSYPKNSSYPQDIQEIIKSLNLTPSKLELEKATIIP